MARPFGPPFGKQWGEMPAGEFETGTVTIALMQVDAFGTTSSQQHASEFHVDDYDAAKAGSSPAASSSSRRRSTAESASGRSSRTGRQRAGDSPPIRRRRGPSDAMDAAVEAAQE
jgi:hypothetical protein